MNDPIERLAKDIEVSWRKYKEFFGEPPHGTLRQIRSMLCFMPDPPLIQKEFHCEKHGWHSRVSSCYQCSKDNNTPIEFSGITKAQIPSSKDIGKVLFSFETLSGCGEGYMDCFKNKHVVCDTCSKINLRAEAVSALINGE